MANPYNMLFTMISTLITSIQAAVNKILSMSVKKDTIFCMFCKKTVPTTDFNNHEKSDEHQNVIKVRN